MTCNVTQGQVRVLSGNDIAKLLPLPTCIELMKTALAATSRGDVIQPLRQVIGLPGNDGALSLMPGALADPRCFGAKVVSVFHGNFAIGRPSHQGVVVLFEPERGSLVALMDATEITARRTAAVSAVATDVLARREAGDLAILGYGQQASVHLAAMCAVRTIRRVRVWGRSSASAQKFAARESEKHGVSVESVSTAAACVRHADIICTTTSAESPVLNGADISLGAHLNLVGSSVPETAEVDAETLKRARVFVDFREAALVQGGELRRAMASGEISPAHVLGEIGEVVLGRVEGRRTDTDITLFKSLGLAAEDLVAASTARSSRS
ncbi:MAG: ornithine cyclodeaminase family protein [Pseudorhodoplanes sp.]|uniref:ornithine cyclodeaminase family protein n=1 Tax=Pseudorhodoplanes sp. TaxID=1934341 RepID=UPI003D0DBB73